MPSAPRTHRYTREEADRALALLRPIAEDARERYLLVRKDLKALRRTDLLESPPEDESVPPHLRESLAELAQCLQELRELGGRMIDPEIGLVTLPGELADGRAVHFCWKLGERRIGFWFGHGESYAERRPLGRRATARARPAAES